MVLEQQCDKLRRSVWLVLLFCMALVTPSALWANVSATGGSFTNYHLDDRIHIFNEVGTHTLTVVEGGNVEVLIVGGGGGGGETIGGGGGGGGVIYSNAFPVTPGNYTVTVGGGGVGGWGTGYPPGVKGVDSIFATLTAIGGGAGAGYNVGASGVGGSAGGNGGGGGLRAGYTADQGNDGGVHGPTHAGGGGGGAGEPGGAAYGSPLNGGDGGDGMSSEISGVANVYGGGGGGGTRTGHGVGGSGGLGGGGAGGTGGNPGVHGLPNTGGGGGGGGYTTDMPGGDGGSGIVIVRYYDPVLAVNASAASERTMHTAVLNGDLGSFGGVEAPNVYFCWGTYDGSTSGTGDWANVVSMGNDWVIGQSFSNSLSGLDFGTTYYYRAYATNSSGEAWSEVVSFMTVRLPSISVHGVDRVRRRDARLWGAVDDDGEDTPFVWAEYWVDGGSVTSVATVGWTGVQSFSHTVTNLIPNSDYVFRFAASNEAGTAWSDTDTFTTFIDDPLTWYVALSGDNSAGTNWATAFTVIQYAVDFAEPYDTVLVNDGVYTSVIAEHVVRISNAVTLRSANGPEVTILDAENTRPRRGVILTSQATGAVVDGFSIIRGNVAAHSQMGAGVYMDAGTVTNCIVRNNVNGASGGFYMTAGLVTHCQVVSNSAHHQNTGWGGGIRMTGGVVSNSYIAYNRSNDGGGGVHMAGGRVVQSVLTHNWREGASTALRGGGGLWMTAGRAENLLIYSNRAHGISGYGGGVMMAGGSMVHCTVADNWRTESDTFAGLYMTGGAVTNSIFYFNGFAFPAGGNENVYLGGGSIVYSCSQPIVAGAGNISDNPSFVDRDALNYKLAFGSAAINSGTNAGVNVDLDGNPRPQDGSGFGAGYDMGCFEADEVEEMFVVAFTGSPLVGTNSLTTVFTAVPHGPGIETVTYYWDFDGNGITDAWGVGLDTVTNTYLTSGLYDVILTAENVNNDVASQTRQNYVAVYPSTTYVALDGGNVAPYNSWETAAHHPASAIGAVADYGTVMISGGVYTVAALIEVFKPVTITGVDGASNTVMRSPGANRLMNINHPDTVVEELSFTGVSLGHPHSGAVVLDAGLLRYCLITNNNLGSYGGGLRINGGLAHDLLLQGNGANHWNTGFGGGAYVTGGIVSNCVIRNNRAADGGGGVYITGGQIMRSEISDNRKQRPGASGGGGAWMTGGRIENALIAGNYLQPTDSVNGGGVYMTGGALINSTVADNWRTGGEDSSGLHMINGTVTNSIFYYNSANYPATGTENVFRSGGTIVYSAMQPLVAGAENIDGDPMFIERAAGNYRLMHDSPAINAGAATGLTIDLDGVRRPMDGNRSGQARIDLGCYEQIPLRGTMFIFR